MQPLYMMPVPPGESSADYAYYQAFVRCMNKITTGSIAEKLRHAIHQTAETTVTSPAHIARLLVDYGLRAPRHAFPDCFVDYVDSRPQPKLQVLRAAKDGEVTALKNFWQELPANSAAKTEERIAETV